jgi:hypothetical protein
VEAAALQISYIDVHGETGTIATGYVPSRPCDHDGRTPYQLTNRAAAYAKTVTYTEKCEDYIGIDSRSEKGGLYHSAPINLFSARLIEAHDRTAIYAADSTHTNSQLFAKLKSFTEAQGTDVQGSDGTTRKRDVKSVSSISEELIEDTHSPLAAKLKAILDLLSPQMLAYISHKQRVDTGYRDMRKYKLSLGMAEKQKIREVRELLSGFGGDIASESVGATYLHAFHLQVLIFARTIFIFMHRHMYTCTYIHFVYICTYPYMCLRRLWTC